MQVRHSADHYSSQAHSIGFNRTDVYAVKCIVTLDLASVLQHISECKYFIGLAQVFGTIPVTNGRMIA